LAYLAYFDLFRLPKINSCGAQQARTSGKHESKSKAVLDGYCDPFKLFQNHARSTRTMPFQVENLPEAIREIKKALRRELPAYATVFQEVENEMRRKVAQIVKERDAGEAVIPVIHYSDIATGSVSPEIISKIKDRGACVVRNTFELEQARAWDEEIARYVEENGLNEKLANAAEDKYFGTLAAAKPQIYGIYWSRPQVEARQGESLTRVRTFLNRLWLAESEGRRHFDPDQVPVYADRIRRRPPGSTSLGLSPHVDGGSVERWLEPNFRNVYRHVFAGNWREYNAFDAVPGGQRCKNFPLLQSVPCFGRFKVGLR
jgi:hypothetical protein